MVLFSFSIPEHIDLIKSAKKSQTTRIPRKSRKDGAPAYKVGDKAQLYYRSRQKKSCMNCLKFNPILCDIKDHNGCCTNHTNFFGESEIIEIRHYDVGPYYENGHELWMGMFLGSLHTDERESCAIADGFKNWKESYLWFVNITKSSIWDYRALDVIVWKKESIIERWNKSHDTLNIGA